MRYNKKKENNLKQNETNIMQKELTIRELAKLCNTSISTVSRVLNGNYNQDKALHRRIKETIIQTGYKPQKQVNNFRNILCVMNYMPGKDEHKFLFMKTVEDMASLFKFNVVISRTHEPQHLENLIKAYKIKGIISIARLMEPPSVPTVILNQGYIEGDYSSVDCYDFAGLLEAFRYLKAMGHRRVAYFFVLGSDISSIDPRFVQIAPVYKAAGIDLDPELIYDCDGFGKGEHLAHIESCVAKWLALKIPPTAIVLSGDTYANDFYNCLGRHKIKIPDDVSMVGFDDLPLAAELNPPLTDIRKNVSTMVSEVLELLHETIANRENVIRKIMINPKLIIRNSVKKLN